MPAGRAAPISAHVVNRPRVMAALPSVSQPQSPARPVASRQTNEGVERSVATQCARPAPTASNTARPVKIIDGPLVGLERELHGVRLSGGRTELRNKMVLARTEGIGSDGEPLLKLVVDGVHRDRACVEIVTSPHPRESYADGPLKETLSLVEKECKALADQEPLRRAPATLRDLTQALNSTLAKLAGRQFSLIADCPDVKLKAPHGKGATNDYQQTNVSIPYESLADPKRALEKYFFSDAGDKARFVRARDVSNELIDELERQPQIQGHATDTLRAFIFQMIYQDSILNELAEAADFYKEVFPLFVKSTLHDVLFATLSNGDVGMLKDFSVATSFKKMFKEAVAKTFDDSRTSNHYSSVPIVLDQVLLEFRLNCEQQEMQWSDIRYGDHGEIDTAIVHVVSRDGKRKVFKADINLEMSEWNSAHIISPNVSSRLPTLRDHAGNNYVVVEARQGNCPLNKSTGSFPNFEI